MPQHDSNMRGANSCANSCAEMDANVFIFNNAATCAHVDFCRASGFLHSAISLCKNPSSLSLCIWVCVEQSIAMLESMWVFVALVDSCFAKFRSTGIQKHHDRLPGFLHSEVALERNPEARQKSTCAHVAALSKIKTFASISAHEFAHEFAPLMFESC